MNYDGTINNENRFLNLIQLALHMEYSIEVFVFIVQPEWAFKSNLERGDLNGRYVPISHYEKVAETEIRDQGY